jgi:hypothetical protein
MTNFNKDNAGIGKRFEQVVTTDVYRRGATTVVTGKVLKDIGVEMDIEAVYPDGRIEWIECKGSEGTGQRDGSRTDNVKKAIANAALTKVKYPDRYVVLYLSDAPVEGNSSYRMLETAIVAKYIDEVRILANPYKQHNKTNTLLDTFI